MTNSNEKHSSQGVVPLGWSLQESKIEVPSFVHHSGMPERLGESGEILQKGMVGSGWALDLVEKLGWPATAPQVSPWAFRSQHGWVGGGVPGKTS